MTGDLRLIDTNVLVHAYTVEAILKSSRWRVIDRTSDTVLKAVELVKVIRLPFWGRSHRRLYAGAGNQHDCHRE